MQTVTDFEKKMVEDLYAQYEVKNKTINGFSNFVLAKLGVSISHREAFRQFVYEQYVDRIANDVLLDAK